MTNKSHKTRVCLSTLALVAFVLYSLCKNLIVQEHMMYYTYSWRWSVLNDLFIAVPFVALPLFAVMARRCTHVNGRAFVVGLFTLYGVQTLLLLVCDTADFSIFCCTALGRFSTISTMVIVARLLMLFFVPIAHKSLLRMYSLGMVLLFAMALYAIFTLRDEYSRFEFVEMAAAFSVDLLFHVALFFFGDLMNKDNVSRRRLRLLTIVTYPVIGDVIAQGDEDEEEDSFWDSFWGGEQVETAEETITPTFSAAYESLLCTKNRAFNKVAIPYADDFQQVKQLMAQFQAQAPGSIRTISFSDIARLVGWDGTPLDPAMREKAARYMTLSHPLYVVLEDDGSLPHRFAFFEELIAVVKEVGKTTAVIVVTDAAAEFSILYGEVDMVSVP